MHARRCQSKRLAIESLEQRQMLAADGMFFPVTTEDGSVLDVRLSGNDIQIRNGVNVGDPQARITYNDLTLERRDGEVLRFDAVSRNVDVSEGFTDTLKGGASSFAFLAGQGLDLLDEAGLGVVSPLDEVRFESLTIETETHGAFTISSGQLFRPGIDLLLVSQGNTVGSVSASISLQELITPIVDTAGLVDLQIDFGDGTVVNRPTSLTFSPLNNFLTVDHTYAEPGEYTITVRGVAPLRDGAGGVSIRSACETVTILRAATVPGTPGDDDISLRNENGRLIAAVNGVDQDLGASSEIGRVEVQPGRGNNTVDASGLLEQHELFVAAIINLDSETNTITGGPGNDTISGGRGPDIIIGGPGNDTITTNRGDDEAHGQEGDDTFIIPGGFNFGPAFETELKELLGGEGFDTLQIADLQDRLQLVSPGTSTPGFDGQFNFTKGIGSSAPQVHAFIKDWEALFIMPQSDQVTVNLANVDHLESAEVHGSPENDSVNFTNSQLDVVAVLGDGDDDYQGGAGPDVVSGGAGDDELDGNSGDDTLSGGTGTNDLNGGAGDDRYSLFFSETGEEPTLDVINDTSGDNDSVRLEGFSEGVSLDLSVAITQPIATGTSIDFNFSNGPPVENVEVVSSQGASIDVTGTTGDNRFTYVPFFTPSSFGDSIPVRTNDGGGGDDTFEGLFELPFPSPFGPVTAESAPNSGDVIDFGPDAEVTAAFPEAFRAVSVDLDAQGVDQVVDVNGNTVRFNSPIRNFVGSAFDDTLQVEASVQSRSVAGGAGAADTVTIDAGGRPFTQTVEGGETTVRVAGYAPIFVTEFETINVVNAAATGGLTLDLSAGDDEATLSLESIISDGTVTLGRFTLTEAGGAFAEQVFLHQGGVTEVRSAGGADTLTIDALGQPVEVVGSDVLIGDLPAIRLVGFTEVTIEDAGVPGDFNRDRVVNAADYTLWRDNVGAASGTLPNDPNPGPIGQAQYDTWRTNFGRIAAAETVLLPSPSMAVSDPEVATALDLAFAKLVVADDFDEIRLRPSYRAAPERAAALPREDLLLITTDERFGEDPVVSLNRRDDPVRELNDIEGPAEIEEAFAEAFATL